MARGRTSSRSLGWSSSHLGLTAGLEHEPGATQERDAAIAADANQLVGLGSYPVNGVAGCNDCHTSPPYAAGATRFSGRPSSTGHRTCSEDCS
jgi:hypothetical protein